MVGNLQSLAILIWKFDLKWISQYVWELKRVRKENQMVNKATSWQTIQGDIWEAKRFHIFYTNFNLDSVRSTYVAWYTPEIIHWTVIVLTLDCMIATWTVVTWPNQVPRLSFWPGIHLCSLFECVLTVLVLKLCLFKT